ncbi:MAG: hypothetical protein AAB460_01640 [Patescibacteria group bacterium]
MSSELLLSIGAPLLGFIVFFVVQAAGYTSEKVLTLIAALFTIVILVTSPHRGEVALFCVGLLLGFFIEVDLRLLGTQQVWAKASLFGVPYWLPLVWGIGFVIITRIGIIIRNLSL